MGVENEGKHTQGKEDKDICMLACGLTKEYGVIASDSAMYSTEEMKTNFESPKLSLWGGKYLVSFLGSNLYFARIDYSKFTSTLNNLSLYLQDYLKSIKPDVENLMKEEIKDSDEAKPYFCLYVLGLHAKKPTLAQFNSFNNFSPRYLWTENGNEVEFSTILYGDDSIPGKADIFKESTKFMKDLAKNSPTKITPGILGEILTRGIYKKADLEMKIGLKKKYAGGIVNAACLKNDGSIQFLSGVEVLNGGR